MAGRSNAVPSSPSTPRSWWPICAASRALSDRDGRDRDGGALLNRYFDALGSKRSPQQDGQILKFMGDGLLAVFPLSNWLKRAVAHAAAPYARLR
jgi:class 3 adenylate cyclase